MKVQPKSPREYKTIPIENAVVVTPEQYSSKPAGWVAETVDFAELSYFLGYKFEPRSVYEIWSPEGVARGGHMESRSRIMTVSRGYVYCLMVDMRPGEAQGQVFEFYLGEGDKSLGWSVLVPEGVSLTFVPQNSDALAVFVGDKPYNKFDNLKTLDLNDSALGLKMLPKDIKTAIEDDNENIVTLKEIINPK